MAFLRITIVLCATLLFNFGLARPRTPQSTRFPQFSDNSVGEFVLWSCTATAQLQKTNENKNIIHIAPAAAVDLRATGFGGSSKPSPSREDEDKINKINVIKINGIPYRNRGRPETAHKKSNSENTQPKDQGTKHKNVIPMVDSPLKTIKVNAFRKDMPILFREKPQLPEVENVPVKEDQIPQHSSEITVIKPYDKVGK